MTENLDASALPPFGGCREVASRFRIGTRRFQSHPPISVSAKTNSGIGLNRWSEERGKPWTMSILVLMPPPTPTPHFIRDTVTLTIKQLKP